MKNWRRIVTAIGLSACLLGSTMSMGCLVRAQLQPAYVVDEEPPRPQEERVEVRAGFVFVRGHWERRGNQWAWQNGHWERERAGYQYQEGRWETRGNRHYWVEGTWAASAGGTVEVHDHRTPPPPPPPTVEIHDHRTQPAPQPTVEVHDHRSHETVVIREYPVEAPPAPQAESPGNKAGFMWVPGFYKWSNGAYVWMNGHWERQRARQQWNPGHWEPRGDRYVWVEGGWIRR